MNLNDYHLRALDGKYLRVGMELLDYDLFSGVPVPIIVKVTKVKKFFGSVISYEYEHDGGHGWVSGGIDAVIQVIPMLEHEMNIWGVRTEEELKEVKSKYQEGF